MQIQAGQMQKWWFGWRWVQEDGGWFDSSEIEGGRWASILDMQGMLKIFSFDKYCRTSESMWENSSDKIQWG